jgi:hypothetical protein
VISGGNSKTRGKVGTEGEEKITAVPKKSMDARRGEASLEAMPILSIVAATIVPAVKGRAHLLGEFGLKEKK